MKNLFLCFTFFFMLDALSQFESKFELGPVPAFEWAFVKHDAVDLDQDGDLDIILCGTGGLGWIENLGGGIFSVYVELIPAGTIDYDLTDFNMDGDLDFIVTGPSVLHYYENNGDQTFESAVAIGGYYTMGAGLQKLSCHDMNSDGIEDVITRAAYSIIVWRESTGEGGTTGEIEMSPANPHPTDWEILDIDGDGDEDLFWTDTGVNDGIWLAYNQGDGTFVLDTIFTGPMLNPHALDIVDMNNDGLLDIVFSGNSRLGWIKNLGGGLYGGLNILSTDTYEAYAIRGVDIDLDGRTDIVYPDPHNDKLFWIKNLGSETFSEPILISSEVIDPGDMNVIDIDGDGDLDIISGDSDGLSLGLFINTTINLKVVHGEVYIDLNENGIREDEEIGASYFGLSSFPTATAALTRPDGSYSMSFYWSEDGTYEISPSNDHWAVSSAFESYEVLVDSPFVVVDTLDFGIYPSTIVDSISVDLIGPALYRCNLVHPFFVNIKNEGTTVASGTISLTLDDSLTYISSEFPPDSIIGQTLYWSYVDLFYFESQSFVVNILLPDGISDDVTTNLSAKVIVDDSVVFDADPDIQTTTVVCAYDPNDKQVDPKGLGEEGDIPLETEWLEYMIRFQNTGTDTALVVVIRDSLDENLDWLTFQPISSSHTMYVDYNPMGDLAFVFDDIFLPDSGANFTASQGFVRYRVKPKPGLVIGDQILNTAYIYFDSNPAVITNTTLNTFAEPVDDVGLYDKSIEGFELIIYPNPAHDLVELIFYESEDFNYTIEVYNLLGSIVFQGNLKKGNSKTIDVSNFDAGLYMIIVSDEFSKQALCITKLFVNR